jgi:16S rRNA (uracil1498-N3)-methyltransferase
MHIFYTPDIRKQESYTLPAGESKHCVRVLRLKKDDEVQLVDGNGNLYSGIISEPNPGGCRIVINEMITDYHKRIFHLHMAIAPTKNSDRFEWFLEKATEIGIDEITPLLCSRSERNTLKYERLDKVIVAAMKQSVIAKKPVLNQFAEIGLFLKRNIDNRVLKFIAHCADGARNSINHLYSHGRDVICLIGPEGDFTAEEIELAIKNRYQPVTLGINRLRTETAGVVACEVFNFLNEGQVPDTATKQIS